MYGWSWRAKLDAIVIRGAPDECWRSDPDKCTIDPDGYAHFTAADTTEHLVHRAAVIADGREIPDGWEVDHVAGVCRYRDCANPAHLEAVPKHENIRRAHAIRILPPLFPCGHDRTLNAFPGSRGCRTCKREYERARAVAAGSPGEQQARRHQERREMVARLAADGLRNIDIAERLGVNPSTVNYYKKTMMAGRDAR
jgi:Bacterial regulatory proteins, luxR family/HNH endonuclease